MKTTFRMTVLVAALGMLSGLAAAQEQGATAGSEPVAATTATTWTTARCRGFACEDCAAERCEGEARAGSQDGFGI